MQLAAGVEVLLKVSRGRLRKAVEGLAWDKYTVKIVNRTEGYVTAFVTGKRQYAVTFAGAVATCSCLDSMIRFITCKHQAMLALWLEKNPLEVLVPSVATPPKTPVEKILPETRILDLD